jgi:uncharacterized repeat protein (TIGR03803 family)
MLILRAVRCSIVYVAFQLLCSGGATADPRTVSGVSRAITRTTSVDRSSSSDFATLYGFPAGWFSQFGLNSVNGMLYGTNDGNGAGDVFSATTSGTVDVLYHFSGVPDGSFPWQLTVADGQLYGVTGIGGDVAPHESRGCGTVFAVAFSGSETMSSPFNCTGGISPFDKLVRYNGALFGVTRSGGANGSGTFFVAHHDGTKKILYSFPATEPPDSGLTELGGVFYGFAGGLGGHGEIVALLPTGAERVVYTFLGRLGSAHRLISANGVLYGTTLGGGKNGDGTIFSITPSGSLTVLADLGTIGGVEPSSPLVAMGGALYGTTLQGGKYDDGLVFKLTYAGVFTAIHSFSGRDGNTPSGDLTEIGRSLYGTTEQGGANNSGALYRITP